MDGDSTSVLRLEGVESRLRSIWERHLEMAGIGTDEDFFDLGGTSVKAISMMLDVATVFGIDLPVTGIVRNSTIQLLAITIAEASQHECGS